MAGFSDLLRQKYGEWALVTGASDGIGRAMAEALAESGLNLLLVARRHNALEQLARDLQSRYPIQIHIIPADMSNEESVNALIAETSPLDIGLFVAAAGFGSSGNFLDAELETELNMIEVNITAVVKLTHIFAKRFAQKQRGGIILFSSLLAFQGVARSANYAATKAYIQSFAEGLHAELAPYGVDVLASAPGPVNSGFAARADMKMNTSLSPETVAKETLAALGKSVTVRPGFLSKFLEFSLSFMPRWGRSWALGKIMDNMTQHQHSKQHSAVKEGA